MRSRSSRCAEGGRPGVAGRAAAVALVAVLAVLLAPRTVGAQACCAGATALGAARLALHEDALIGVGVRVQPAFGAFDGGGTYRAARDGTSELGAEEQLVGALRVLEDGQLSVLVPLVETWRSASGASESSAGLGDVHLAARWDLLLAGERGAWPGIALSLDVGLPTGTAVDQASKPLATDATGLGAVRLAGGLGLEQVFGSTLVALGGTLGHRFARTVSGVSERTALEWGLSAALGHVWATGAGLALTLGLTAQGDAELDGAISPESGRHALTAGVSGGTPIGDDWRLQGSLQVVPPISGLAENQLGTASLTLVLARTWR